MTRMPTADPVLARAARFSLLALATYSALWGLAVPAVHTGVWGALGLPDRIIDLVRNIPPTHLPAGYALIIAYGFALMRFIDRRAIAIAYLSVGFLLHLVLWLFLIGNPAASSETGYLVLLVEAVAGISMGTLYFRDYFREPARAG